MIRPLLQNLGWRLFSLVAAIVLWVTFVGSPDLTTSVFAPIEYRRMPPELEMSSELPGGEVPERVYLEIQGPSARLHSFDLSSTRVLLDLSGVSRPGEHTFFISRAAIDLPPGLKVIRTVPAQIRLRFEKRATAQVSVRVRLGAKPQEGYFVASQTVEPDRVTIMGPESRVREVEYVETDPVDVSQVLGTQEFRVQTFVRDPHVRIQSQPSVKVTVTLLKKP